MQPSHNTMEEEPPSPLQKHADNTQTASNEASANTAANGNNVTVLPKKPALNAVEPRGSFLSALKAWLRQGLRPRPAGSLEESVAELLEEHDAAGNPISAEERNILNNLVEFGELKAGDIMVPRTDIIAVDYTTNLEGLKQIILEKAHTRMPVFRNTLDDIIGFIHIKDVFKYFDNSQPFVLDAIIRPILYVPPSMKVTDLLVKMRTSRIHMALVLDEYGGTDGLVTSDNIVEEIVGEIKDEHDTTEEEILTQLDENSFEASARVDIEELEEKLGVKLSSAEDAEDIDTLGGLIFFMLGRVPSEGEVVQHSNHLEFKILEADPRRIKRVLIQRLSSNSKEKSLPAVETVS